MWSPSSDSIEQTKVKRFIDRNGLMSYNELVKKSVSDISWWWSVCEKEIGLEWFHPYDNIVDVSHGNDRASWFPGGSINLTHNVLDNIARSMGTRRSLIWEGEDGLRKSYSFSDLSRETNMLANLLKGAGVKKGDVVVSCLPMLPEAVASMLSAIKIGAVFSPVFCGYGPAAIASRLSDSKPKIVVTCDGYLRRGKRIEMKPTVDKALQLSNCRNTNTIVVTRLGNEIPMRERLDEKYEEIKTESANCQAENTGPNDPAILLYTSGTTGTPKGAVISHAGALLQPGKELMFNLDVRQEDVFMWMTDIGWMMGPWQVVGAQLMGAAQVMFEGVPDYPNPTRVWELVEEYGITHLGHSATTMRMLKKYGEKNIEDYNLSSLRILGNTGEPIDRDTWMWEMKNVGHWHCPLINLSGGTEIFGSFLLPSPIVALKPCTLWGPGLGMDVDVLDDDGKSVRGRVGYLVCKKPAPSMTRGFWNNFDGYFENYWKRFPGLWYHGDWALVDEDGLWYLHGRVDDVIKVSGRRIGPAEIESALNSHPSIAESATVGIPDEVRGEKIYCFVQLKPKARTEEVVEGAKALVIERLGKVFEPDRIFVVEDLPRTRSGKIVRRLIRSTIRPEVGMVDTTNLENPDSLEKIRVVLADDQ